MSTLLPTQWTATTDQNTNQLLYEGATYWVQNSGKSWSFTAPTNDTLRFELRPYDGGASFDVPTVDRSEIAGSTRYAMGTDIHVSYDFQIEPGAANHAQWLALGQFHETPNDGWQQPYGMFLSGERMTFIIDNAGNTANDWSKYQTLWTDSQDIVRGHTYHMQIDARFDLTNGYLHVVRDGVTLIDYHGPMGWSGMDTVYWKEGLYRGASDTDIVADYSNLSITTGAAAPPPPAPPPAAPTGLADTAIVGGYVNAARDTASQALTGSAAAGATVTVYDGATQLGAATANSSGQWSYTLGQLADGAHSLTATATTSSGVSAKSAALGFTVDTHAPAAPTGLADSAIINGVVDAAHDTASQALTGLAEAGAKVSVYDGASLLGSVTANSSGQWSYTLGQLASGSHSLTAKAADAAGNVSAASNALQFSVSTAAAPAPPAPTGVTPHLTDVISLYGKQVALSGAATAGSLVKVFDSGVFLGTATADTSGAWSLSTRIGGGVHSFTEQATDSSGATLSSTGVALFSRASGASLVGGSGNDVIVGRSGDTLTGGGGSDTFVFNKGFGLESVTDFNPATDHIGLDHTLFSSAADVLQHATQSGTSTLITYDGADVITLKNTSLSALTQGNFLFV